MGYGPRKTMSEIQDDALADDDAYEASLYVTRPPRPELRTMSDEALADLRKRDPQDTAAWAEWFGRSMGTRAQVPA